MRMLSQREIRNVIKNYHVLFEVYRNHLSDPEEKNESSIMCGLRRKNSTERSRERLLLINELLNRVENDFDEREWLFIQSIMDGISVKEAIRNAHVGRSTAFRWLNEVAQKMADVQDKR